MRRRKSCEEIVSSTTTTRQMWATKLNALQTMFNVPFGCSDFAAPDIVNAQAVAHIIANVRRNNYACASPLCCDELK